MPSFFSLLLLLLSRECVWECDATDAKLAFCSIAFSFFFFFYKSRGNSGRGEEKRSKKKKMEIRRESSFRKPLLLLLLLLLSATATGLVVFSIGLKDLSSSHHLVCCVCGFKLTKKKRQDVREAITRISTRAGCIPVIIIVDDRSSRTT